MKCYGKRCEVRVMKMLFVKRKRKSVDDRVLLLKFVMGMRSVMILLCVWLKLFIMFWRFFMFWKKFLFSFFIGFIVVVGVSGGFWGE